MRKLLLTIVISLGFITSLPQVLADDTANIGAPNLIGIRDGDEFDNDVTVLVTGAEVIMLNGAEISQGFVINEIGNHTIELLNGGVVEKTIHFTITPRFTEDFDGVTHLDKVFITLENRGTLFVNNREVVNGEAYTDIGYYNIRVEGINDYVMEYTFTLENSKLSLVDGTEYTFDVLIDVDDYLAVYMYNSKQKDDIALREYGYYEVKVLGLNNFLKTYKFTIGPNFNNLRDGGVYTGFVRVDESEAQSMYIDGNKITGVRHITTIGNHTVIYQGLNGYVKTYNITIKESDLGIDGKTFDEFKLTFKGVTVDLNDKKYKSGDIVDKIGYYTVRVNGVNGYFNEYDIFVYSETTLPEEETNQAFNLFTKYETVYVNGAKVIDGYRITETGEYDVLLWGEGNYTEHYTFTYTNEHVQKANDMYYVAGTFGVFVVITYAGLLWRRFK